MPKLYEMTIAEMQAAMECGELTARELAFHYLNRIAELDKAQNLNAVLEINPDALFLADELDKLRREGTVLGPLHGIPVLLKDNINTGDKMPTTAGSYALLDNFAVRDAHIVARLRAAGALILGRANLTEFANFMTREGMPNGYSARGGAVRNFFTDTEHPGGSSTGSAVSVRAGFAPLAVGTETSGSIMSPAHRAGTVGIKPTIGLVSRSGILPISGTLDTAGPIARTVEEAALLLSVLAGKDPEDPATGQTPEQFDACALLHKPLKGLRIGVNRWGADQTDSETQQAFELLLNTLKQQGVTLVDNMDMAQTEEIMPIMRFEFKRCLNAYLSNAPRTKMRSMRDIIQFNQDHPELELRYGQSLLTDCENNCSGTLTEPEYLAAMKTREEAIQGLDKLFLDNCLDAMVCAWNFTNLAPYTGFPSGTVPIGQKKTRMPIGAYVIARRYEDAKLVQVLSGIEKALNITLI